MRAAIKEFAGKIHDDLIDRVNSAVSEGVADPEKVAIVGGSYGGYATLIGVSFTPDTFACGVGPGWPSSLATLIESFPEYWKPFLAGAGSPTSVIPGVEEERADMLERSAISRVDDIKVPLLVGQGEMTPRVTKLESDQLVEAMSNNELPVTSVNFPDEGHGFQRPENRLAFYSVMEGFLAQCLGGRAEDIQQCIRWLNHPDSLWQRLHLQFTVERGRAGGLDLRSNRGGAGNKLPLVSERRAFRRRASALIGCRSARTLGTAKLTF